MIKPALAYREKRAHILKNKTKKLSVLKAKWESVGDDGFVNGMPPIISAILNLFAIKVETSVFYLQMLPDCVNTFTRVRFSLSRSHSRSVLRTPITWYYTILENMKKMRSLVGIEPAHHRFDPTCFIPQPRLRRPSQFNKAWRAHFL